jgi:phosphatidylglycerol:prolipoprotein diacylglycerol transferase
MHDYLYIHNLSPFVFQISVSGHPVGVRWYGLAYVVGFILAYFYFRRATLEKKEGGITEEALPDLVVALVFGVMLGGRIGFVAQHIPKFIADPLFLFRIWEGGMAFFGGLAGVVLAFLWVAKRHQLKLTALTDTAAFPAALGLGIGRIANFINAELVGKPTGGDWGVIFPNVDNVPRHPSQLYESVSHFVLFAVLALTLRLKPGWAQARTGRLSWLFLTVYGFLRFLTDFYRDDDTSIGPFSTGQWASLVIAFIGLFLLWRYRMPSAQTSVPPFPPAPPATESSSH